MLKSLLLLTRFELLRLKRDRIFWSLAAVALVLLLGMPVVADLSMRQPAQTGFTLSFSLVRLFLLVLTVFMGTSAISRALERRTLVPVLALPVSRGSYLVAVFIALALVLLLCAAVLNALSLAGVWWLQQGAPIKVTLSWWAMLTAYAMTALQYLLLLAWGLLFSVFSTSFFLPVFGTLGVYLAGNATYQIVEYLQQHGDRYSDAFIGLVKGLLYVLPNFHAFDFQVYAAYNLNLPWPDVAWGLAYGVTYTVVVLWLAVFFFQRREL